jgi:hypothetical protein
MAGVWIAFGGLLQRERFLRCGFFFFYPFAFLFRVDTLGVSSFPWKSMWRVKSSFESEFLCVDGQFRKDSDYG